MNRPVRLAIVDDYAVVVAGVASFLKAKRIDVVEGRRVAACHHRCRRRLFHTFG